MPSSIVLITVVATISYSFWITEQSLIMPECIEGDSSLLQSKPDHTLCETACTGHEKSFETEDILQKRFGRRVNITRLVIDYSLICPLDDTCGNDINQSYKYDGPRDYDAFKDCPHCTCDSSCQYYDTCCPGCYYGYIDHECMDFQLYPNRTLTGSNLVPTIGKCAKRSEMNSSLGEMCSNELKPCQLHNSCLIYKNKHCALCHGENETCFDLVLNTECYYFYETVVPQMSSYESIIEFIHKYDCMITYNVNFKHDCKPRNELRTSSCNITGLWTEYDAEIEWACEHFRTPYGKFKNVFCYICNPSMSNTQISPVLNKCPNQSSDPIPKVLSDACENLPSVKRLCPYRNIYCLACQSQFTNAEYNIVSGNLVFNNEIIDNASLSSDVHVSIRLYGLDLEEILLSLLETYFNRYTPTSDSYLLNRHNSTNAYFKSSTKEVMEEYKVVCGTLSPCSLQNGSNPLMESYRNIACEDISCSCENTCASLFTCCPEFLLQRQPYSTLTCAFNDVNTIQNVDVSGMPHGSAECYETWNRAKEVIIIGTCLAEHNNETIRNKCESMEFDSDKLKYIPVTDGAQIAYRNIYCLICNNGNGVPLASAMVSLQLQCNVFLELKLGYSLEQLLDIVTSNCDKYSFFPNSRHARFSTDERHYNNSLTYTRNALQGQKVLKIKTMTFYDKCNITGNWTNKSDSVQRTCEDTTANILALKPYKDGVTVYKNFACFICNPRKFIGNKGNISSGCEDKQETALDGYLSSLCNTTNSHPIWAPYENLHCANCNLAPLVPVRIHVLTEWLLVPFYKYIFSISKTDFLEIFKPPVDAQDCGNGTYDHILRKCRKKYCLEGNILENNHCVDQMRFMTNSRFITEFALYFNNNNSPSDREILMDFYDLGNIIKNEVALALNSETKYFMKDILFRTMGGCESFKPNSFGINQTQIHKFIDITKTKAIYASFIVDVSYSPDPYGDKRALLDITEKTYVIPGMSDNGPVLIDLLTYVKKASILTSRLCYIFKNRNLHQHGIGNNANYNTFKVDKFLFCPMSRFSLEDSSVNFSPLSLNIHSLHMTFETYKYKIVDEFVYICEEYIERVLKPTERSKSPLEDALNTTTFVCTILSIACLSLTFITYCVFPQLREKVIGKSNMILCLVLSVAQALLQFGMDKAEFRNVCAVIGALMHFFMVCSYCTMNVCAFNMFKIFYVNRHIRDKRVKFRKYLAYMIFFPLVLVGSVLGLNLFSSNWTETGYGQKHCFISDFYQMIGLFFVPSTLIFLTNACFFSLAYFAIRSSPGMSGKQDRRDFFLYLKLCSVVGLTWPLLIIDNLIGLTGLSFVVSGLNALQGVFIFFSYVLNRRVMCMYHDLISGPKSLPTPS